MGGAGQCAGHTDGVLPGPCEDGVDWWDVLDVIGMDAYFVLNGTSVDEIVQQWGYAFLVCTPRPRLPALTHYICFLRTTSAGRRR